MDATSKRYLTTLLPGARPAFEAFLAAANEAVPERYDVRLISGTRSYAEQDRLYAQGRTAPGQKVTNARAGFSNHNFGIAGDIGVFFDGKYLGESEWYARLGETGKACGLSWGGDWQSFKDRPHYEFNPQKLTTANLRERVRRGQLILPDSPDVWSLYLGQTRIGNLEQIGAHLCFSARAILNRLYGRDTVDANLVYSPFSRELRWGDVDSAEVISDNVSLASGVATVPVKDIAAHAGLEVVTDSKLKKVTLRRPLKKQEK